MSKGRADSEKAAEKTHQQHTRQNAVLRGKANCAAPARCLRLSAVWNDRLIAVFATMWHRFWVQCRLCNQSDWHFAAGADAHGGVRRPRASEVQGEVLFDGALTPPPLPAWGLQMPCFGADPKTTSQASLLLRRALVMAYMQAPAVRRRRPTAAPRRRRRHRRARRRGCDEEPC